MKKLHIIMSLVILSLLTSCLKDQEDVFDKSSAQRAEETIAASYKALTSAENGWLVKYYPSPYRTYGGYNFIMKFTEDGKVTVAGDSYYRDRTAESLYKITQSAGVVLSFDTYNDIFHLMSDPSAPLGGSTGKGLEGDYDFEFISVAADKIVLKGKKSGNYATMTPMPDSNWKDYLDGIAAVEDGMSFPMFEMNVGETEVSISQSYRSFDMTYVKNEQDTTFSVPYIITPEGIEFYEPIEINNQKISGFKYAEGALSFACVDNESVVLNGIVPPLNETFVLGDWYIAYSQLGAFAQPYWAELKKGADGEGEEIGVAAFTTDTTFGIYMTSGQYGLFFNFIYELIGEDQIKLYYESKSASTWESNADWYVKNAGYGYGMVPFGHNKDNARTFKLTADNVKSPKVITMYDQNEPTNVIKVTATAVSNPFSN